MDCSRNDNGAAAQVGSPGGEMRGAQEKRGVRVARGVARSLSGGVVLEVLVGGLRGEGNVITAPAKGQSIEYPRRTVEGKERSRKSPKRTALKKFPPTVKHDRLSWGGSRRRSLTRTQVITFLPDGFGTENKTGLNPP